MRTIALRFAESFAPECGTIAAHNKLINELGYAWYGKLGSPISMKVANDIMQQDNPRILLIHSGGQDRWWAHVGGIKRDTPEQDEIPLYYQAQADDFGCWFKVTEFERAENNVMSKCTVSSSGNRLTSASRHSMSPYFIVDYEPEGADE